MAACLHCRRGLAQRAIILRVRGEVEGYGACDVEHDRPASSRLAPCGGRGPHRPPGRGGRPLSDVALLVHRADAVCRGADALCLRHRPRLDPGIDHVRPCRAFPAGGGMDAAAERPCARRRLLFQDFAAGEGDHRSPRRAFPAAAVHGGDPVFRASLCGALLGDPGALPGNGRPAFRLSAQDAHCAVRAAHGAPGRLAGNTRRLVADPKGRARRGGRDALMGAGEIVAVLMVIAVCVALFAGYPLALTLARVSLAFAAIGQLAGILNFSLLGALPARMFGIMPNEVLLAIPLFIFMGVMLERSRIAEELLEAMGRLFGTLPGGLGISVLLVGVLLAAAKGVVGATTVTIGLIMLPSMLRHGYDPRLAAGTVAATATLAQIFPPATVLVLLGDQMSNAYQSAQLAQGIFAPQSVTVSDLFAGAIIPAFALVGLYLLYLIGVAVFAPAACPALPPDKAAARGAALAA